MNKKSLFFGMAAFAIAALVFVSCDNGATEVEGAVGINNNKAPQVGAVDVKATTNGRYFIVSWNAVAGDVDYTVWAKQNGKITPKALGGITVQNQSKYDDATGVASVNKNTDKWSVRIDTLSTEFADSFNFGVRTLFNSGSAPTVNDVNSNITWSAPVPLTELAVSSVTLTKGASAGDFTISFTKPAPTSGLAYTYTVGLYTEGDSLVNSTTVSGSGAESLTLSAGSYLTEAFTAKVTVSDVSYTSSTGTYYNISQVRSIVESNVESIGTTW